MPRSRRYRKSQNQVKPEWGKNNPQAKAKNKKTIVVAAGIVAIVAVVLGAFLVFGPNGLFTAPTDSPSPSPSATFSPSATPLTSPTGEYSAGGTKVLLATSMGDIIIQMRDDKPVTTKNFVDLVKQGFYDGTVFHRIIDGFMIQGGVNQTVDASTINDEIGSDNRNIVGSIAMAKTSEPNSASSSFFINVADNGNDQVDQNGTKFDSVYTVFGQVISGMDVVMQISQVPVKANSVGENSQPVLEVTLFRAEVLI